MGCQNEKNRMDGTDQRIAEIAGDATIAGQSDVIFFSTIRHDDVKHNTLKIKQYLMSYQTPDQVLQIKR
jgi:hypothetical protein